ncbi:MAG TPA: tetratricopeptide repeat protein [Kofleriaceae bacterium]|nr:tetratricopeptide repeat protein [Kofleriaceae bacterium]
MRVLAVLLLLTLPAAADSKALLRKGRELQAAKKYGEAIAAFEGALKLQPDDPTVLGELGWTAYLMKDYAKAKDATQKAIAHEAGPNVRGAALYNLGLVDEAQGDTAGAVAAYSESLRARPNATVRAALKKLDPKAAEPFDPYRPAPLAGPFASIAAYCKSLPATHTDYEGTSDCACYDVPDGSRKLAAPFANVTLFRRGCGYGENDEGEAEGGYFEYKLAVQVASGWFFATLGDNFLIGHGGETFKVDSVKAPALASAPSFAISYRIKGSYSHTIQANDWDRTELVLVGVGASGKPSGTPPILRKKLEIDEYEDSGPLKNVDIALDLAWGTDTLTVTAKRSTGLDAKTSGDLIGSHRIAFP